MIQEPRPLHAVHPHGALATTLQHLTLTLAIPRLTDDPAG
ncbi:hypothetical protein CLV72_107205 [Allonocardiopsis opalescens]|uniref:Uncharacterized protein n=1 Tax=Allonocardiopsis opalescens TaxID=1144618 RepID=A0A2T0PYU7_9ACTN|nr:hypothetical protein CLV72_107205 [Allonocardiopsis opalescens]